MTEPAPSCPAAGDWSDERREKLWAFLGEFPAAGLALGATVEALTVEEVTDETPRPNPSGVSGRGVPR